MQQPVIISLNFNGRCVEAFERYAATLGSRIESVVTYAGSASAHKLPSDQTSRVKYAVLHLPDLTLIGWDSLPDQFHGRNSLSPLVLKVADACEAECLFMVLARHGSVIVPFGRHARGMRSGRVLDEFGMLWVVTHAAPKATQNGGGRALVRLDKSSEPTATR